MARKEFQLAAATIRAASALALSSLLGACAATRPVVPPSAQDIPAPELEAPAPIEKQPEAEASLPDETYPLPEVSGEPGIDQFTALLEGAGDAERPALLLDRAMAVIEVAQRFRRQHMKSWNVFGFEDELHYVAYYALVRRDCEEILERFPDAPEAPEAQFTLGLINDYPHLTHFQEADDAYSAALENYPGTEAARKATARRRRLRELLESSKSNRMMQFP